MGQSRAFSQLKQKVNGHVMRPHRQASIEGHSRHHLVHTTTNWRGRFRRRGSSRIFGLGRGRGAFTMTVGRLSMGKGMLAGGGGQRGRWVAGEEEAGRDARNALPVQAIIAATQPRHAPLEAHRSKQACGAENAGGCKAAVGSFLIAMHWMACHTIGKSA